MNRESTGFTFEEDLYGRFYWKNLLCSYDIEDESVEDDFKILHKDSQFILLHGPYGSGKTRLASCFGTYLEEKGYQYFGIDLAIEKINTNIKTEILESIENKASFVFLENLEDLNDFGFIDELAEHEVNLERENWLIVLATSSNYDGINGSLKKYFTSYFIDYPNDQDREVYFKRYFRLLLDQDLNNNAIPYLVEHTKNANYLQLDSIMIQMFRRMKTVVSTTPLDLNDVFYNTEDYAHDVIMQNEYLYKIPRKESTNENGGFNPEMFSQLIGAINNNSNRNTSNSPEELSEDDLMKLSNDEFYIKIQNFTGVEKKD